MTWRPRPVRCVEGFALYLGHSESRRRALAEESVQPVATERPLHRDIPLEHK